MSTDAKRDYFNDLAARWDAIGGQEETLLKARRFVFQVSNIGARAPVRQILDVGCGTGILLPYILEAFPTVQRLLELDLAEAMLRENGRKIREARVGRVCADVAALPLGEPRWDRVLCFGVLPHVKDIPATLRELWRVLGPGGVLSVGHPMSSQDLNRFHEALGEPIAGDVLPTAPALARILEDVGGRILSAEENFDGYFVSAQKVGL